MFTAHVAAPGKPVNAPGKPAQQQHCHPGGISLANANP